MKLKSETSLAFQEADLRYLVENIWNGQSALSALEDLHELVLVRWNKYEHWSPWNCVLLSKEEAAAHSKLENVNEVGRKASTIISLILKQAYGSQKSWRLAFIGVNISK